MKQILTSLVIGVLIGALVGGLAGNLGLGMVVGLGLAVAGYFMQNGAGSLGGGRVKSGGRGAYNALLAKARGDEALVERLVTYEQERNPRGTRTEWVADALDRWERDRT